jgi:hypothetical protein
VIGCGSDPNYCTINHHILVRDVDAESIPEFRTRAIETAQEIGADFIVFELMELRWIDDLEAAEPASEAALQGELKWQKKTDESAVRTTSNAPSRG